jgi:hypothetical protein
MASTVRQFRTAGLVREPLRERNIGFALLRWLLRPTAERHAFEREGTRSK